MLKPFAILKALMVQNGADRTKQVQLEVTNAATTNTKTTIQTAQTADRVATMFDATDTVVGKATTDIFTNKTFDADGTGNVLSNVDNANIKALAAIDASKIADGSVSSTEFQFINSVTSNVQDQLNTNAGVASTAVQTASNVGAGAGLSFKQKTGTDLEFRSIKAGTNITITNNATDITIDSTGSGTPSGSPNDVAYFDAGGVFTGTDDSFQYDGLKNLKFGLTPSGGTIEHGAGSGSLSFGDSSLGAVIRSASASLAMGQVSGAGSSIQSLAEGAIAAGQGQSNGNISSQGAGSLAMGFANNGTITAGGQACVAIGRASGATTIVANASGAVAIGNGPLSSAGVGSVVFGEGHDVSGVSHVAIGQYAIVTADDANTVVATERAFTVGTGTSGTPADGFNIYKDARMQTYASQVHATRLVTNDDDVDLRTDRTIWVDSTTNAVELTLPTGEEGLEYIVKDIADNASVNNITFVTSGGDLMDSDSTISTDGGFRHFQFEDSTSTWEIIAVDVSSTLIGDIELYLDTGNGNGSVGNFVRRFSNIRKNTLGVHATYADSATDGMSVTIITGGRYSFTFADAKSAVSPVIGIGVNAAANTSLTSLSYAAGKRAPTACVSGNLGQASVILNLDPGDIITAHTDQTTQNLTIDSTIFNMVYLGS